MSGLSSDPANGPPVIGDLNQVEAMLHEIEQTFNQDGPQGDHNMRNLIYEKFRSQVGFELGHFFITQSKRDNESSKALLEEKCASLEEKVTETKKDTKEEIENLQGLLKTKERECCDLKAHEEIQIERY